MEEAGGSLEEALLFALDDLRGENFKRFKNKLCFLKMEGKAGIPWSDLQHADTVDTMQLLFQTYGEEGALDVAVEVLKNISLRGSASRLQKEKWNDRRQKYKQHVRATFCSRCEQPIHPGTEASLHQTYTEPLLTRTSCPQEGAHELMVGERKHREMETRPKDFLTVSLGDLFDSDAQYPHSKTTVLLGPAGVGKTTAMWKVMVDWASGKLWQDRFDYVFCIPCGAINHDGQPMSVVDLILCSCCPGIVLADDIFMNQDRILVILDGFDELTHPGLPSKMLSSDLHKKEAPGNLVMGLLGKKLLAKSHLIVTARPTALESLRLCLKLPQFVEVLGFRPAQRKEYFHRFFENKQEAALALETIRRNETIFSMCFLPMVCWIICSIFRQKPQNNLLKEIPETATLTEIHMLLLFSFLGGRPRPRNLEGLCSLAKDGVLHEMTVFDEEVLKAHGLRYPDPEDLSESGRVLHRSGFGAATYKFAHLSFQEFFAALFFLLEKDGNSELSLTDLNKVSGSRKEYGRDHSMLVRFLFGLSNTKRLSALRKMWGCQTSGRGLLQELLKWVEAEAQHRSSRRREHLLELCHCAYEVEDTEFARRVMGHVHNLDLRDQLSTKLDFAALSFCLSASDASHSLRISGYTLQPAGFGQLLPGLLTSSDIQMNRCGLSTALCESLSSIAETNQHLTTLDLGENPLRDLGVIPLCNSLIRSGSKLQCLRLNCCGLTAAACESLSRVLTSNQCLTELDLGENHLGDLGVRQLCKGLKHPQSRLQRLTLHCCGLTAAVCEDLASVLETSETLMELGLGENKLGDEGVRQLSMALKRPGCKLQRLVLTMTFLNAVTKKKLQAACAAHPQLFLASYYPPGFPVFPGEEE
ncbi:NACHT, LRR and PYD domains-containing protein 12-like [Eublepharis macularius]|uniref:NACHT, LRR and PYD domains-containing protein 3 n=1 Tax=Eublepharis macularius TaxID=481883 RepID=A0AA97JPY7_EUBMA|nr:NACHT, LRR and PYD domains-containing protein 12-like [Eublepharis macularius]